MYLGNIAPWEQYPKHLRFSEIINPLKVITDFFSSGWPSDHRQDLKEWRYYVLNAKFYKDRHGPGHVLFIYDQTLQLIEAMHLLLLKNKDRWPRLQDVTEEQIEQEMKDWIYFPKNLSAKELANPYEAVKKCFKKTSPQEYRDYLKEWLNAALYKSAADETLMAGEIIDVYDNIRKLYSAAWLIHQRETSNTFTHKSWGRDKLGSKSPETIVSEELSSLKDLNPELTTTEKLGMEEVKKVIVDRVPSVSMIYLMGTHPNPFTYYVLVLVEDKEKTPEHEIANKIEDNCRYLALVFAIVHKLASAKEALAKNKRFWHNTLYKSINIYKAPNVELTGAHAIDDKVWLERAQHDWNRWGLQGKEFLKGAIRYMEDGNYNLALFSLHQAAESSLIAIIRAVLGYRLSVHNLSRKIRITLLFTEEIKAVLALETPQGVLLFNLLQTAYSEARYKSDFKPDDESVTLLKERVSLLLRKIAQVYLQFIKGKESAAHQPL
ncbi:HEPN domain-containing protein [Mucilaginibacter sp. Bleaf8]|uniref:HEPN domain-containing protein n=1 Tax=Mucilaginibacter sp. Bleaf8 TaxID=2834430 RepID=UPI001BD01046|nr:HEPN domain-containing protein [Mucilaginibacter sp. Bleaf8]MBS7566833.1 HEPN domain-containing protein [Mucilaginibacter sp. Bleaf8]